MILDVWMSVDHRKLTYLLDKSGSSNNALIRLIMMPVNVVLVYIVPYILVYVAKFTTKSWSKSREGDLYAGHKNKKEIFTTRRTGLTDRTPTAGRVVASFETVIRHRLPSVRRSGDARHPPMVWYADLQIPSPRIPRLHIGTHILGERLIREYIR